MMKLPVLSDLENIFLFIYLFSHLADAFVQSDLQMRAIEAIKNQQKSNNMQVLWQVLVSLTQYT